MEKKPLKKLLPKNFEDILKEAQVSGDISAVQAVFESCDINARGGYGKRTALMMRNCTPVLARWLVAQGADVNAADDYGDTPLHGSAFARFAHHLPPDVLLDLGADVHKSCKAGRTALHSAADGKNLKSVELLLAHSAHVDALSSDGQTPMEYALQRLSNNDLVDMVPVVTALLASGARSTQQSEASVKRAVENFEFHRAGFNIDSVEETSRAARTLCELFQIEPPAVRHMHDGKSPIVAVGETWIQQYDSLWQILIPSSGACETVQGEVVRIAGRVNDELLRNGGVNWDRDFGAMLHAWQIHLASHHALSSTQLSEANQIVTLGRECEDHTERMIQLSLVWVAQNPMPVALIKPTYKR
jgi:Ankyrin repeats (many copies)